MAVVTYKCSNCGGDLRWDPEKGLYVCEFCDSMFSQDQVDSEAALKKDEEQQVGTDTGTALIYNCPNCGAEIITEETTAATECFYCHNPIILTGRLDGQYTPDYIIPFSVSREEAVQRFLDWVKGKRFVPKAFFSKEQIERMTGVYFPFWMLSADLDVTARAKAERKRISRMGNQERIETSVYNLIRDGDVHVGNISHNALKKADRELVEAVLPYQTDALKPFNMAYLSGFQAEKRDLEALEMAPVMEKELQHYAEQVVRDSFGGNYSSVQFTQLDMRPMRKDYDYVLFPVWALTYQKHGDDKTYYYALNGQTGKIAGELPVDEGGLWRYAIIVAVIVALIFLAGGYLL